MIFSNFVPLIASYLQSGIVTDFFFPILCLAFIATVPVVIKYLVR